MRNDVRSAIAVGSGLLVPADFNWDCARLAFNPRGTLLAAGDLEANHVLVLDPRSGRTVRRLENLSQVEWLGFVSAAVLLMLHREGCTRFDLRKGRRVPLWPGAPPLRSVAVAPGGRIVAMGVCERYVGLAVILYDVVRQSVLRRVELGLDLCPQRLTFSTRGGYVAADCWINAYSGPRVVVVWDTKTGRRLRTLVIPGQSPACLTFRGETLALTALAGHVLHLFEPDQGEDPAATFDLDADGNALAYRDGVKTLAVFGYGGEATLLRAKTGQVMRQIPPPAGRTLWTGTVNDSWSVFAAATKGGVLVWPSGLANK